MNNFLATYCNAVNRTSCVAVASHAKNTPPLSYVKVLIIN